MSFQDLSRGSLQDGGTPTRQLAPSPARSLSHSPLQDRPGHSHGGMTPTNSMRQEYAPDPRYGQNGIQGQAGHATLPNSDPEVSRGVFQMNTAVSSFKRLVNSLGTPKDTFDLRQKLHKSRQYVTQLGKDIAGKLKDASARDHEAGVSTAKKLSDAKLAKDFQAVLREFEKAQHMAVEREAAYMPLDSPGAPPRKGHHPSAARRGHPVHGDAENERPTDPLLREQQRQEMVKVESELAYTEAVIEEREQGIQEIQHQILEVNEIFRDLAVLVKEQGVMIDDIEANIESTHSQNIQANKQLLKAAKSQKETNSFVCWIMAVFAIGLFILFLVMSS